MRKLDFGSLLAVLIAAVINRSVLLMMNPFGLAYFAAAYMTVSGRGFLFIASLAGMATVMPIKILLKYAGIMLGMIVIEKILRKNRKKAAVWQMALCCSILVFAAGFAYSVGLTGYHEGTLMETAAVNLMEGIAVFCLVFIFHKALGVVCADRPKDMLTNEEQLCTGILIAASLYAISGTAAERYSVISAVAFFLLFYIGYRYGCGASAVAGACIGSVFAINANDIGMLGCMCLAGVAAGAFREKGKIVSAAFGVTAMGFMGYLGADYMIELTTVRGILAGAMVFVLLPMKRSVRSAAYETPGYITAAKNLQAVPDVTFEVTKKKLKDFSQAFKKLSETFRQSVMPRIDLSEDEVNEAFDEVTQNVCAGCSRCELCWEREYNDTYQAACNILDFYSKNGNIGRSQIPVGFRHRCINIDGFLNETGRALEMAKLNLNWKNRFMESRLAVAGQFMEVADIIDDFSDTLDRPKVREDSNVEQLKKRLSNKKMKVSGVSVIEKKGRGVRVYISGKMRRGRFVTAREICQVLKDVLHKEFVLGKGCRMVVSKEYKTYEFVEDTCYRIIEGFASCPVKNEEVSGDTWTTLHLDNGQVIMSLSDGMGTGRKANEESGYIIQMMEQLLDTGFGKCQAVRLMNSLLFLKSDSGSFSTVDIGMIDLYTGQCEFIKMGAAASVIIHEEDTEIIESKALPAGAFTEAYYEEVTRQLSGGDMIVMVSDGIIHGIEEIEGRHKTSAVTERDVGSGELLLKNYLEKIRSGSPQEIADRVLAYAGGGGENQKDDMTVLVCGIYRNLK